MKEIPLSYVKANQTGIVLTVILALALRQPYLLLALFLVQAIGFVGGVRANAFVLLARPFLRTEGRETQAAELTRFNNALILLFLAFSLISFALGWTAAGYVFAVLLACAAFAALCGYCIGCTVYYQYKRLRSRLR